MRIPLRPFALVVAAIISLSAGCTPGPPVCTAKVNHFVLCWLKEPGNLAARSQLIEASRGFSDIPGVVSVSAGPALKSNRPVVDSSFDLAIAITFDSEEALQDYLDHPDHKAAVKDTLQPLVKRIRVYDFVDVIAEK